MAEKELAILVRAKGAIQAATEIGKVDTAVGNVSKNASKIDTVKTKFGNLKTAIGNTNTQVALVGTALAGLENFVPPTLRPIVDGLQDLNRIAPNGLPGLVGTALSSLKTITATEVTVIGKAIAGPGGLFPPLGAAGGAAGTAAGAAGTLGAGAIVGGVAAGAVVASVGLLALGKVVEVTSTKEQLAASARSFNEQQILKHTGQTLEQIRAKQTSTTIYLNNRVTVSSRDVATQNTVLKVLSGGIQQI